MDSGQYRSERWSTAPPSFSINLDTLEQFLGASSPRHRRGRFWTHAGSIVIPRTSEEFLLARLGRELYEAFYLRYTIKQWDAPRQLDPACAAAFRSVSTARTAT